MTQEQILEILDSYKLRIPPTVFYDLKADIVNYEEQEPTTKNDLPHCQHTDEEIAKSFIEDVEAVKDQLHCSQMMDFPESFDDFVKDYGFRDKKEIYTNGSELIPVFRVKQWLEHIQEPQTFKWCTDCREYDQEKHCCHRWSKAIRDTVEEMKQEYIEREVLDKIRAEIERLQKMCSEDDLNLMAKYDAFGMALDVLDKYKAKQEET